MNSPSLAQVTPVVLTYNEEVNIGHTLDSLRWAGKVIVLDSGSTDETERIARSFANVIWHVRAFDNHQAQWEYGITQTGITSEYVLALDADMQVSAAFLRELEDDFLSGQFAGGVTPFHYCYHGHSLAGSLCPPQLRLFRRSAVRIAQRDHTQHFSVDGSVYRFRNELIHDDRKSVDRWVSSQLSYQLLNEKDLTNGRKKRLRDHLRAAGLMPPLMGLLAYVKAGGPLKGAAAARYAYERMTAESILAIRLMDERLKNDANDAKSQPRAKR